MTLHELRNKVAYFWASGTVCSMGAEEVACIDAAIADAAPPKTLEEVGVKREESFVVGSYYVAVKGGRNIPDDRWTTDQLEAIAADRRSRE